MPNGGAGIKSNLSGGWWNEAESVVSVQILGRSPAIPTGIGVAHSVSLSTTRAAASMLQTRFETSVPCHFLSLGPLRLR